MSCILFFVPKIKEKKESNWRNHHALDAATGAILGRRLAKKKGAPGMLAWSRSIYFFLVALPTPKSTKTHLIPQRTAAPTARVSTCACWRGKKGGMKGRKETSFLFFCFARGWEETKGRSASFFPPFSFFFLSGKKWVKPLAERRRRKKNQEKKDDDENSRSLSFFFSYFPLVAFFPHLAPRGGESFSSVSRCVSCPNNYHKRIIDSFLLKLGARSCAIWTGKDREGE